MKICPIRNSNSWVPFIPTLPPTSSSLPSPLCFGFLFGVLFIFFIPTAPSSAEVLLTLASASPPPSSSHLSATTQVSTPRSSTTHPSAHSPIQSLTRSPAQSNSLSEGNLQLTLNLGESQVIKTSEPHAWVENGQIIEVTEVPPLAFRVKGLRPGFSHLRLGTRTWEISVLTSRQSQTKERLIPLIQRGLNLKLEVHRGQVLLKGRLVRWKDWKTLLDICQEVNCDYQNLLTMTPSFRRRLEKELNGDLRKRSLPPVQLDQSSQGGWEVRLGSSHGQRTEVESVLARAGIHVTTDAQALDLAPLVDVKITVAEIKKDRIQQLGIQWPGSFRAQLLPHLSLEGSGGGHGKGKEGVPDSDTSSPSTPGRSSGDLFSVDVKWLESNGLGRVLASPNLLCRSGKEAHFLAGGEFPIKIVTPKKQDVVWKKYGVVLDIKPLIDAGGRMSIFLETEISTLDRSQVVNGIPALHTNRIQSHFDLPKPRTIILSGLIKELHGDSRTGWPGLLNLPVLGSLFSSQDFQQNRTELVIFVYPHLVHVNPSSE